MEEWKVYPEFPTYEVSNNGQVRNRKRGNILKPHEDKDGYLGVCYALRVGSTIEE